MIFAAAPYKKCLAPLFKAGRRRHFITGYLEFVTDGFFKRAVLAQGQDILESKQLATDWIIGI